eukprot:185072_1
MGNKNSKSKSMDKNITATIQQPDLFNYSTLEKKKKPEAVALVSGYVRELEIKWKESDDALTYDVPQDIYDLCLLYYPMIVHYKNEHTEYIRMKNSDPIKTKNIFEFECPQHWIQVLELEINALASDQNWGNTGHDYFDLIITKSNEKKKSFRLFSINHKKHKGFYRYSAKYVHDTNPLVAGPLQEIESGDKLTVRCHCAPYPGWEIKVKHAEIAMIYLQ